MSHAHHQLQKAQRVLVPTPGRRRAFTTLVQNHRECTVANLAETRRDFPHADLVGVCTIFNIKGHAYRLVSKIYYPSQTVLVRFVLTHAEYDKGTWKHDCEC
jgi:mRNA interferase HigB